MNLFDEVYEDKKPLAFRYRPKSLDDFLWAEEIGWGKWDFEENY